VSPEPSPKPVVRTLDGIAAFGLGVATMAAVALLGAWSWLAVDVFVLGGGDTTKWGSPFGAFEIGVLWVLWLLVPSLVVCAIGVALWARFSPEPTRLQVVSSAVVGAGVCVCCASLGTGNTWAWPPWNWLLIGGLSASAFVMTAVYLESWRDRTEMGF
jgi:hypothetical protein